MTATQVFLFAQAIGVLGLVFTLYAFQSKRRSEILFRQIISSIFFAVHFGMLGAMTGSLMNIVLVLRNLVFREKLRSRWANHAFWLYFFLLLTLLALVYSWQGWLSFLPALGLILGTYAIWQTKPSEIRLLMLLTGLAWIPYTIVVHSYSGLFAQLAGGVAILIGMARFDKEKEE